MNILLLSVGTRNKIVQYFKKELIDRGLVIATDASRLAPALYEADKHYVVPKIDDSEYLNRIKSICLENNVKGILSLIDPELSILAKHKQDFIDIGVIPIISDSDVIELCYDKYKFNEYIKNNGFNNINSYVNEQNFYKDVMANKIIFPVFVKPIFGSASTNVSKAYCKDEVELLFKRYDSLMIQEFMDGKEYGVDVYIDIHTNKISALFIKEKLKMRAGETDKSVSIHDEKLKSLIIDFVYKMKLSGVVDIDVFKVNGEYYISEVNPRFGGGYPHAYESGINIISNIIDNLCGKSLDTIQEYKLDVYMLKYNEIIIL